MDPYEKSGGHLDGPVPLGLGSGLRRSEFDLGLGPGHGLHGCIQK